MKDARSYYRDQWKICAERDNDIECFYSECLLHELLTPSRTSYARISDKRAVFQQEACMINHRHGNLFNLRRYGRDLSRSISGVPRVLSDK